MCRGYPLHLHGGIHRMGAALGHCSDVDLHQPALFRFLYCRFGLAASQSGHLVPGRRYYGTVDPSEFTAMLVGVLVGVTGAWADWMIRMLTEKGEPPYRIVFYFLTTGTIVGAALTLMTGGFHAIDFYGLALILLIGLFGTLGQFTLTYAWKYGVPLINTLYQYSGVVFAVILGLFLFDDSFDWITILGIFIVCASGIAASLCGMKERENKRDSSALLHHD